MMKQVLTIVILVGILCLNSCSLGPKKWEGANWRFHKIVKASYVEKMISFPMKEDKMIIDSRPYRAKYVKGHIPGAVSIPYSKFDKMEDKLPENKNAQIVFYCGGLKCPLSHKSAWKAEYLGYKNVAVFAKGFPAWKKVKGHYPVVSVEWLKKQIDKKKNLTIVDSRPKRKKYDKGHIPKAISIPNTWFNKYKHRLPRYKKAIIVFYCGGLRCPLSHKSAKKAIRLGYKKVKVFAEGYPAWKKFVGKNAPIKIKGGAEEGSIDNNLFKKIMKNNPRKVFLVDVREPSEFADGTLKTAINIPVGELEKRINELPKKKHVVFFCSTGARSGEAYYMIKDVRPSMKNIFYVDANMTYKKDGSFKLSKPE